MKSGQIWVSAVLYMALGIILISIILAVGVPVINKVKDKYTVSQTKDLFLKIDENVRAVYNEGEGSQRPIKLDIGRGVLTIDQDADTIHWEIETTALLSEPGIAIKEGNLNLITQQSQESDKYIVSLTLDYNLLLDLSYTGTNSFSGTKRILIKNIGGEGPLPIIELVEI